MLVSPSGVRLETYKNWLTIDDPQSWRPGAYLEPTVMHIHEGHVECRDVTVRAVRGPQDGVYILASTPR